METVLSIAGSDTCAGAGIQQDLKTITAMGCYGATVITAITSQNTLGVQGVMSISAVEVRRQIFSVLDDLDVKAVKIGMIPDLEVAVAVVTALREHPAAQGIPVVYDPVMISTSGRVLMDPGCFEYVRDHLFRLCTVVTPNIPEAERLVGCELNTPSITDRVGAMLCTRYRTSFLIKGGHAGGEYMTDCLYTPDGCIGVFRAPKVNSANLHGTGCTLSSAIASALAQGSDLAEAVDRAKRLVTRAVMNGRNLGVGHGNGPLWLF